MKKALKKATSKKKAPDYNQHIRRKKAALLLQVKGPKLGALTDSATTSAIIGKNVTIGHLVMLHGCTIGDNSLIGIGAVILNNAKIGKNCIIGSKSLITENKEIPDNSLVMGSPGKIIRQLTDDEIEAVKQNAIRYQENWKKYSKSIN